MLLNGRAPKQGEIMRFPDLAKTFRALVDEGRKGFYEGRVAEAIVELIRVRLRSAFKVAGAADAGPLLLFRARAA